MPIRHLSAPQLAARLADARAPAPQLLDVREPWEVALGTLPGALAIPMGQLPARLAEIFFSFFVVRKSIPAQLYSRPPTHIGSTATPRWSAC